MNIFKLFQSRSVYFYFFLVLLSLVGSITNLGMLMTINIALGGKSIFSLGKYAYLIFIVFMVFSFVSSMLFQNYMVRLSNEMTLDLELKLIKKVRNASFESFERLGTEKLYAAISDTRVLSRVPEVFIGFVNAAVTIVCSLIYFMWVSPVACVIVIILMFFLLVIYLHQNKKVENDLNKVRDLQDVYYGFIRELVDGFKQVRISFLRNSNLYDKYILVNKEKSMSLNVKTSKRYVRTELIGAYSWYLVLGFVIFFLPMMVNISVPELTAFITTVLFMKAPVSQIIMVVPFYTGLKIAINRIERIDTLLETDTVPEYTANAAEFHSVRFENIICRYESNDHSFELRVPDFKISKQEIVFIIGGNGSGKTTFIHLLTGLCKPICGQVYLNDKEITWQEFQLFSNNMAAVFSNHHLFTENYDEHELTANNEYLNHFTHLLNLKGVLRIDYEKERIDTKVSKGQQKRIALLMALMEKKPILVLDEWAAEQDPFNKKKFYTEWLTLLRDMGQTIIAVSHDDEFYHVPDRLVKFNYGQIVSDTRLVQVEL
ncbi:MAG: ATP-binding cassette domain-containing protein [Chitinophaga sp.]|uniref:ATP-binding cassette domain-containing protein n=1 Tax=Chitinophaga sp. TaxID=1869181 RepID=UPI001B11003A|nr:ATP-binding cassette domain-containing protein [Chitinophaga sp.]MBO9730360.1 ATP-binding cassette domain-containing protein [Chitinophaga sp.]